ncbi:MAG: hypothetical protein QOH83_849 [Solirubrobacteraceae bacterium]|nr:hypothetical protein [Solirubrobacteraceae bacterium]
MSPSLKVAALSVAGVLAAPGIAVAKPHSISLKLSKAGYTVVALDNAGHAVKAAGRNVKLTPTAARVTLHLVDARGNYAGPIVVAGKGAKVVVGLRGAGRLGTVKVKRGYGLARAPKRALDKRRTARARAGVPVGALVLGRVAGRSKEAAGAGLDVDRDGVPGAFDVDDDGDLLLDNVDKAARRSARQVPTGPPNSNLPVGPPTPGSPPVGAPTPGPAGAPGAPGAGAGFTLFSNLKLDIGLSVNANAGAVTDAQIDDVLARFATLAISVPAGDEVELDCLGLAYCSAGGTGTTLVGNKPFPGDFDADGDGFGTNSRGDTGDFQLHPGATSAEIGSGDSFIQHVTSGGVETTAAGTLNYVFSTTPALTTFTTAAGSGTISYPVAPGGLGTDQNPIPVPAGSPINLAFWRPQRKAIAGSGEGSGFVDIGHLSYSADIPNGPSAPGRPGGGPGLGGNCQGQYASTDADATVTSDGVLDKADDRAAAPANTLSFTVDVDACLAANAVTWAAGDKLGIDIQARAVQGDNAAQKIWFKRA